VKRSRRPLEDYRRLMRRNLPSLLTYKFLSEYGYDKGPVVVKMRDFDIWKAAFNRDPAGRQQ
jgi:hypothetical protein